MARFRCHDCNEERSFVYDGRHACPRCESVNVQFALSIEELAADDPLIAAMTALAEGDPAEPND